MSFRSSNVGVPIRAIRAAGVPRWYAPGDIRAIRASRAMSGLGATRPVVYYPRPARPGVWFAPGDIRAIRASRAIRAMSGLGAMSAANVPRWYAPGDIRAIRAMRASRGGLKGLLGLLGLGTDVMTSDPGSAAPGQNVAATAPTQAPDGSMAPTPLVPVATSPAPAPVVQTVTVPVPVPVPSMPAMPSSGKKWYSFLETTKPDGTVTGPLGISWTVWIIGGGAAALMFASRNEGGGESTPNTRRRRRKKSRRNARRRRSR